MKQLHDIEVEDYLYECVTLDPLFVNEEFTRISHDLAYWNERYSRAYRAWLVAKINEKRTFAFADQRIRAGYKDDLTKATEPMIAADVAVDDGVYNAQLATMEAEVEKLRIYGVIDALRAKRDALTSIGAHVRAEMAGDPAIRALHAGRTIHTAQLRR